MTDRKIVFCGDSFAAATSNPNGPYQWKPANYPSYLDILSNKLKSDYLNFSYAGKGLWYSSQRMFYYIDQFPEYDFDTLVLIITSVMRFPSSDDSIRHISDDKNSPEVAKALEMYFGILCDYKFHEWTTTKILDDIRRAFPNKKIISFFAFKDEMRTIKNAPGMVCSTPLAAISYSEFNNNGDYKKSMEQGIQLDSMRSTDISRPNHLNKKNNQALAESILYAMDNYQEGQFDLDLSNFDIVDQRTFDQLAHI